ncbi:SMI1/KNR4 family protein [Tateyamaria sp. ANG-S1]|uniref:SMI1/KNR4 family protein n=1 Tax=Tateyamaria sp. ANG-S1 TaxID=1577905 RepID=UPI0005801D8F|nr:SMI1/KNR4 family protein [Tateyamaria sp. ANG-S1]KIC47745.1 hypothetical protein RA29_19215 [Tateyamaria sp. ANG-S1]
MTFKSDVKTKHFDIGDEEAVYRRDQLENLLGFAGPDGLFDLFKNDHRALRFVDGVEVKAITPPPSFSAEGKLAILQIFGMASGKLGIAKKSDDYRDRFFGKPLPFADDGLGNLFVWDPADKQVKFWHHECLQGEGSPEALTLVAKSFEEFLRAVRVSKPVDSSKLTAGAKKVSFRF